MYPYYGYPQGPPPDMFEKGMKIAMKLSERKERQKEKHKEKAIKEMEAAKQRRANTIEWYVIGIMSYPLLGPLYQAAIHHLEALSK